MKKIINEATLKHIIYEAAKTLIENNLRGQMSFGVNGNIPLQSAVDLCADVDPQVLAKVDSGDRSIPRSKVGDPQFFGDTEIWTVYQQYSAAISRRADLGRKPVSFFIFLNKVRNGWKGSKFEYYESNGNYLLGIRKAGVFLCVYLAPKNAGIGMFKFIKEVCEYDNVVFAVTDDMASMLERLGCPKYDGTVSAKFRGHTAEKQVYGSTQEAAEIGAKLVGLMGKSGDIAQNLQSVIAQSPELSAIYEKDPELITKLMADPTITQFLLNHPDIVDKFISDPSVAQNIASNPLEAFMSFIKKKSPKTAGKLMNEMRRRKHGFKL